MFSCRSPNSARTASKDYALRFRKSHNSGGDLNGALVAHETKRPGQHVRAVRVQSDGAAFYVDWLHWAIGLPCRFVERQSRCFESGAFRKATGKGSMIPPLVFVARSACNHRGTAVWGSRVQPQIVPAEEQSKARWACSYHHRSDVGGTLPASERGLRLDGLLVELRAPRRDACRIRCCQWAQLTMPRSLYATSQRNACMPRSYTPFARWRVR